MTKKERVYAAMEGKEPDHVPTSFSLHFPKAQAKGLAAADAHLKFFQDTDMDVVKIMNENLVPYVGGVNCGEDFKKIKPISMSDGFMQDQAALARDILSKCDREAFALGTLHGVLASTIHPLKGEKEPESVRYFIRDCLREDPKPVLKAMEGLAEGMCQLAKAYAEAGVDGIYYAALGGERHIFTDQEFEQWIKPLDFKILKSIKDLGIACFLHICKDNLNMERYRDYAPYVDVVNWGVYEAPFSLEEGRKLFSGKAVMGGLANRAGVMVDGTVEELKKEAKAIIRKMGKIGFLLGADCTLPTEISYDRIKDVTDAAREI